MKIFASDTFISEVKKLMKSGSHADCEIVLIDEVMQDSLESIIQKGTPKKIGGGNDTPFIRRRLNDGSGSSGGYRLYLWAFRIEDEISFVFIHPKTGRRSGYKGLSVKEAAEEVVHKKLVDMGGSGGVIALDTKGNFAMPFNTAGMYRGYIKSDGKPTISI